MIICLTEVQLYDILKFSSKVDGECIHNWWLNKFPRTVFLLGILIQNFLLTVDTKEVVLRHKFQRPELSKATCNSYSSPLR